MRQVNRGAQFQQFLGKMMSSVAYQKGNAAEYSPDEVDFNPTSPLVGKKMAFLGSSVTYGFAAKGKSFVDYLAARDGVVAIKSAISVPRWLVLNQVVILTV